MLNNNFDIVFVGAGPVGLWTAIQSKIKNSDLKIVMVDKHSEYKRTQQLRIDGSSLKGIPDHEGLKNLCSDWKNRKFVPIQEIESGLKEIAKELGIQFQQLHVKDTDNLKETFQKAKVIVGADGARSTIRESICEDNKATDSTQHYLVQVKYKVKGKKGKIGLAAGYSLQKSVAETRVDESYSSKTEEVALRFFVDKATYSILKDARLNSPLDVDHNDMIPLSLKKKINNWIYTRQRVLGEEISEDTVKELTSIQLDVYTAKEFAVVDKENPDLTWCLVGDAAGGVPYFRSLNKGLLEGTELAKVLSHIKPTSEPTKNISSIWRRIGFFSRKAYSGETLSNDFKSYASYVKIHSSYENLVARIKTAALSANIFFYRAFGFLTPNFLKKIVFVHFLNWEKQRASNLEDYTIVY